MTTPGTVAAQAGLTVVKSAAPRTVLRGGGRVVKVYREVTRLDRVRGRFLGRSPGRREAENLERARRAGLPVPRVIERTTDDGGTETLVLHEIAGARSLEDLVRSGAPSPARRRAIARGLGDLVRRVHDSGLSHPDLHAGNVLLDDDDALWLVDLHSARFRRRLRPSARRAGLLGLGRLFLLHATRTERLRFLLAYDPERARIDARRLERALRRSCETFWRRRLRRRYRRSRHVRRIRVDGARGLALTAFEGADALAFREAAGDRVLKAGRTAVVTVRRSGERDVVAKRFLRKKPLAPIGDLWRASRARRAFERGHALLMRGISTPEPLAFLERHGRFGLPAESLVVHALVTGEGGFAGIRDERIRRDRLRALGRAVRRLNEAGFDHRDLKLDNWIWSDGTDRPTILDLDALRAGRPDDQRTGRRLERLDRDLLAAGVTRTDRLRVVLAAIGPADRARCRRILASLEHRARARRPGS